MQASQIITATRNEIGDSIQPYRWDDEDFIPIINRGRSLISTKHPESRYVSSIVTSALSDISSVIADDGLTGWYSDALIHFVAYTILSEMTEDAAMLASAEKNYQKFAGML